MAHSVEAAGQMRALSARFGRVEEGISLAQGEQVHIPGTQYTRDNRPEFAGVQQERVGHAGLGLDSYGISVVGSLGFGGESSALVVHFDLEHSPASERIPRLWRSLGTLTFHEHDGLDGFRIGIVEGDLLSSEEFVRAHPTVTIEALAQPLGPWVADAIASQRRRITEQEELERREGEMTVDEYLAEHTRLHTLPGLAATVEDVQPLLDLPFSEGSRLVQRDRYWHIYNRTSAFSLTPIAADVQS